MTAHMRLVEDDDSPPLIPVWERLDRAVRLSREARLLAARQLHGMALVRSVAARGAHLTLIEGGDDE